MQIVKKRQKLSSSQGYNDRLDETLSKDGKESTKKQSLKSRRDESKGMEKSKGKRAYSSDPKMDKSTKPLSSGNPLSKDNELPKYFESCEKWGEENLNHKLFVTMMDRYNKNK